MLPFLAQGAASSLEDGAVLGHLLGQVKHEQKREQLPKVATMYQALRKHRGESIRDESFVQRDNLHMPDGERQRARDDVFMSTRGKETEAGYPNRWECPTVQRCLYGYDAYKDAEEAFAKDPF